MYWEQTNRHRLTMFGHEVEIVGRVQSICYLYQINQVF